MATMQREMKTLLGAITKVREAASEKQREMPGNLNYQPKRRRGCAIVNKKEFGIPAYSNSNHFARHCQMKNKN
jgi:hypothetical protein